jgi:hypothetical protein
MTPEIGSPSVLHSEERGGDAMAENILKIKLTDDQQKQIKNATGKNLTELNIDIGSTGDLSLKDLDQLSGGTGWDIGTIVKM